MKKKIVIIGGRGTGIVIADQIRDSVDRFNMKYEILGLALDDRSCGNEVSGYPILCDIKDTYEKYKNYKDVYFMYQLYRPDVLKERCDILYNLNIPLERFINFIHPLATVSNRVKMGTVMLYWRGVLLIQILY